jgi:hypothetical protein
VNNPEDHYRDAFAVLTSALENFGKEPKPYFHDVTRLLANKSEMEVAMTLVGLGQVGAGLLLMLSDSTEEDPRELLRRMAVSMAGEE